MKAAILYIYMIYMMYMRYANSLLRFLTSTLLQRLASRDLCILHANG